MANFSLDAPELRGVLPADRDTATGFGEPAIRAMRDEIDQMSPDELARSMEIFPGFNPEVELEDAFPAGGIQLNNPTGVHRSKENETNPWVGQSEAQAHDTLLTFDRPEFAIRATSRILRNQASRAGTLRQAITAYKVSPDGLDAYLADVSSRTGIALDAPIDLTDFSTNLAVTKAIIQHESGRNQFPDELVARMVGNALGFDLSLLGGTDALTPEELAGELERMAQMGPAEDPTAFLEPRPSQPGVFERNVLEPLGRIADAAKEAGGRAFGEAPLFKSREREFASPLTASFQAMGQYMLDAGAVGLRGLAAGYDGLLSGFRQGLVEAGVGEGMASRATRDLSAFLDVMGIAGAAVPLQAGRAAAAAGKVAIGHEKQEAWRVLFREREEFFAKNAAINAARKSAEDGAVAASGAPLSAEAASHARALAAADFDVKLARAQDAAEQTRAAAYLRSPDQILTDVPVFTQEVLNQEGIRRAIEHASDRLKAAGRDPTGLGPDRIFKVVMDMLSTGELSFKGLAADLAAAGVSRAEYVRLFGFTASESGRALNQLSQMRQDLRKMWFGSKDPEAAEWLAEMAAQAEQRATAVQSGAARRGIPALSPFEAGAPWWQRSGRLFRKLLVSLPVTAVRNFIESSGFRQILNVADRATEHAFRRIWNPNASPLEAIDPFGDLGRMFVPSMRDLSEKQLDTLFKGVPEARFRLFAGIESGGEADLARHIAGAADETVLGRAEGFVDKYLLAMNRAQSLFVRKATMAGKLDRNLRRVGSSLEEVVDHGKIPAGFDGAMSDAIEFALFNDFAMPVRGQGTLPALFKGYTKLIDSAGMLGAALEPFPRFIYNATKLMLEHMPTAGLRLITPKARAAMLEGNFDPLAREFTGSVMFATALALRQGDFPGLTPGASYDEVLTREGGRISFAPFVTILPHLFLADLVMRIDEGRIQPSFDVLRDIRRGVQATAPQLERIGSGIDAAFAAVADINSLKDMENLGEFGGELATGFLRPLQILRDFRAEWNEAVAVFRETRGRGFTGPVIDAITNAIPGLDPSTLPERESPTRAAPPGRPRITILPAGAIRFDGRPNPEVSIGAGIFSHISGTLIRQPRNAIEDELVRQGFTGIHLSPKTGEKQFDALVLRGSGPVLEAVGNEVVKSPMYLALQNKARQEVLRNLITLSREPALKAAKAVAPAMAAKLKLQDMPGPKREMFLQELDTLLRSGNSGLTSRSVIDTLTEDVKRELQGLGL